MLWVIEGVDRTGKSSLCETLQGVYGGDVLHFSAPEKDAIAEYVEPLITYAPGNGRNLYVDRHFLGELVWPTFFGRASRMTGAEWTCIEHFLASRGALCVLTRRDVLALERVCVDEPIAGRVQEACGLFVHAAAVSMLPWWRYEHDDDLTPLVRAARVLEAAAVLTDAQTIDEKQALVGAGLVR